jgi:L-asparaginase
MKTAFIFSGGTIAGLKQDGVISPCRRSRYMLLEKTEERYPLGEILVKDSPFTVLSENMTGDEINRLKDCICSALTEGVDGVIVTHGTDTLQYTACLLGYMFGADTPPIVLVSANYPLSDERSNGVDNCVAAADFIKHQYGRGVFVSYKNADGRVLIHRATRVIAHDVYSDELRSVDGSVYGEYVNGNFQFNPAYKAQEDGAETALFVTLPEFCRDILWLRPYTGMGYNYALDGVKAVLHDCFHSGTLRTDGTELSDFASLLKEKGIPFYLTGTHAAGDIYASMQKYADLGVKILPKASPVAMYCKLWLSIAGNLGEKFLFTSHGEDIVY